MTVQVKICGITDARAMDAALGARADFVGLVFFPPSPRAIDLDLAAELAHQAKGRARRVGVFVDPDDAFLENTINTVDLDYIQLHGDEQPTRVEEVASLTGLSVIKAIKVASGADLADITDYKAANMLLLDGKAEAGQGLGLPGGNGIAFPWSIVKASEIRLPWILSGGLSPDNVAEAIAQSGANFVDVSSGVEVKPGIKDPTKIQGFVAAAKATREGNP